jgi:hypothetical protein
MIFETKWQTQNSNRSEIALQETNVLYLESTKTIIIYMKYTTPLPPKKINVLVSPLTKALKVKNSTYNFGDFILGCLLYYSN